MRQVNIHEAKTQLSKLIEAVEAGEEIVLARAGKPVAKLVGVKPNREKALGILKGKIWIAEDFDDPLPDSLQRLFEGGEE